MMHTPQTIDELRSAFIVPGVSIDGGHGGLPRVRVETPLCTGEFYLHGAHVTAYAPTGHQPVLWMSSRSAFASGKAIRGGVPICYPWFGSNPAMPAAPAHGIVRTVPWELVDVTRQPAGEISVILKLPKQPAASSDDDAAFGDGEGVETYFAVLFGESLELGLLVKNNRNRDLRFEVALHTYFTVSDVREISISGLQGSRYVDKTRAGESFVESSATLQFTEETDRVYESDATCVLTDPQLNRRVINRKLGAPSTVIWNAWPKKAADIGLAEGEWQHYACIESAAIGNDAILLPPGKAHTLGANISVERLA